MRDRDKQLKEKEEAKAKEAEWEQQMDMVMEIERIRALNAYEVRVPLLHGNHLHVPTFPPIQRAGE